MAVNVVLKSVWDDKGIKSAQKEFADFGKGLGTAFAAVGAATAVAAGALIKFGADSIAAAENVAVANNRLQQVAQSMGIFGAQADAVSKRLIEFAEANELTVAVDAEVIKATQAKLLTFKNLASTADEVGGAMDRATMAALDLAAAGFGSAETNAVQLGKALQDPIKGITALARAGVTFTAQEKENIRVLVESGKTLEAQNLILQAIETQVGGTAQATAKASDKMKLAFDNVSEAVGAALLPVFNEFADEIIKITPELERALAPAAAEIATIFRDEVLPAIKDFTQWLASPQGTKTLKDLTQAVIDAIKGFIDFIGWVVQNREALGFLITSVVAFTVAVKAATIATNLHAAAMQILAARATGATLATTAFTNALKLLPWAAAIAGATWFVSTMQDYANEVYGSKVNTEGLTQAQADQARKVEGLQRLLSQYHYALENGTEANKKLAREGIARVTSQLEAMGIRTDVAGQHLKALNNIKLNGLYREVFNASSHLKELGVLAGQVAQVNAFTYTPTDPAEETAAEKRKKAFDQVQKFIKSAQKELANAQAKYSETVAKAQKNYADSIIKTEADFAKKLSDIVQKSQDRLRTAFAQATRTDVSALFESFKTEQQKRKDEFTKAQADLEEARKKLAEADAELKDTLSDPKRTEKQLRSATENFEEAKAAFTKLNEVVSKGLTEENPVDALLTSLRSKLKASETLLAKSGALAAAGFSQTFIEQIVSAGTGTGNELADAILNSTPDAQRELQSLFRAIETTSETGMDSLARQIYESAGLATRELIALYETTQIEQQEALKKLKADFDQEILDANKTLIDSIKDIREAFKENIDGMKGELGGLGSVIKDFYDRLNRVETEAAKAIAPVVPGATGGNAGAVGAAGFTGGVNVLAKTVTNATGILIDSINDLELVRRYFEERIVAASEFAAESITRGNLAAARSAEATRDEMFAQLRAFRAQGAAAVGTVININVKTDSTQSQAMVGKTLGNTITKYVTTGGQVVVSPVG